MTATGAVARASTRVLVRHVVRAVGGPRRAGGLVAGVLAVGVLVNVLLYRFAVTHLGAVLGDDDAPEVRAAMSALTASLLATAPVVAAGALTVLAPSSMLRPTAVTAGAGRPAIVVGELLPFLVLIAVVVGFGGVGPVWFVAERQSSPPLAFAVLALSGVVLALAAMTLHAAVLVTGVLVRLGAMPARVLAAFVTFAAVGMLYVDLLAAALDGRPGVVAASIEVMWGGASAATARAAAGAVALVVVAAVVLVAVRALERGADRLVPTAGRPVTTRGARTATGREVAMMLRHPVVQTTLVGDVVLVALLVVGVRTGYLPTAVAHTASALLFAALAETAYGRSAPWAWVRRSAGYGARAAARTQFLGALPVGAVLTSVAVLAAGVDDVAALPRTMVGYGMMAALAFLAGVIVPFSDAVPTAIVGTSLVALGLEALALALVGLVPDGADVLAGVCEVGIAMAALVVAERVVGRRWAGSG